MVSLSGNSFQHCRQATRFSGETSVTIQPGPDGTLYVKTGKEVGENAPQAIAASDVSPNAHKKTLSHRLKMAIPLIVGNGLQLGGLMALLKNSPKLAAALFIPGIITEIGGHALITRDQWFARKKSIGTELMALPLGLGAVAAAYNKKNPLALVLGGSALFLYGVAHQKFTQAWKEG